MLSNQDFGLLQSSVDAMMERLASLGQFVPPTLGELEQALDAALDQPRTAVTVDLWDVERLASCASCRDQRIERLRRINLSGIREAPIRCTECEAGAQ